MATEERSGPNLIMHAYGHMCKRQVPRVCPQDNIIENSR